MVYVGTICTKYPLVTSVCCVTDVKWKAFMRYLESVKDLKLSFSFTAECRSLPVGLTYISTAINLFWSQPELKIWVQIHFACFC